MNLGLPVPNVAIERDDKGYHALIEGDRVATSLSVQEVLDLAKAVYRTRKALSLDYEPIGTTDSEMLTIEELSEELTRRVGGYSYHSIRRLIEKGHLRKGVHYIDIGTGARVHVRLHLHNVLRWILRGRPAPEADKPGINVS